MTATDPAAVRREAEAAKALADIVALVKAYGDAVEKSTRCACNYDRSAGDWAAIGKVEKAARDALFAAVIDVANPDALRKTGRRLCSTHQQRAYLRQYANEQPIGSGPWTLLLVVLNDLEAAGATAVRRETLEEAAEALADAVLKAAGFSLRNYTLPSVRGAIVEAARKGLTTTATRPAEADRVAQMSEEQLRAELTRCQQRWDTEEFEGGGSPRESLDERMQDIEAEMKRRDPVSTRPAEATGDAERGADLLTYSKLGHTAAVPLANSVVPAWIETLSLQQQSVVLLALRGPDGVRKYHPAKVITIAYRGTVLRAAERQRFLYWGEAADTFMSMEVIADEAKWREAIKTFFAHVDELPHHYVAHLAHAAQIIACHHPHETMRQHWGWFYSKWCDDLHVSPESFEAMDRRLDDWGTASARTTSASAEARAQAVEAEAARLRTENTELESRLNIFVGFVAIWTHRKDCSEPDRVSAIKSHWMVQKRARAALASQGSEAAEQGDRG